MLGVSADSRWVVPSESLTARLEDGTLNFQAIASKCMWTSILCAISTHDYALCFRFRFAIRICSTSSGRRDGLDPGTYLPTQSVFVSGNE